MLILRLMFGATTTISTTTTTTTTATTTMTMKMTTKTTMTTTMTKMRMKTMKGVDKARLSLIHKVWGNCISLVSAQHG